MSYRATIAYKKIEAKDVFSFMVDFKQEIKNNIEEIAKRQCMFAPTSRHPHKFKDADEWDRMDANVEWANSYIFKYRWFYIPEDNLLGVFGIHECTYHLFDNISFFQNSCDQDYDYESWYGIPEFEAIVDKWRSKDDEAIKECYKAEFDEDYNESECSELEYYRRSAVYDEIWGKYGEDFLYYEDKIVYLTLFGDYEKEMVQSFAKICEDRYKKWEERIEKETGENNG